MPRNKAFSNEPGVPAGAAPRSGVGAEARSGGLHEPSGAEDAPPHGPQVTPANGAASANGTEPDTTNELPEAKGMVKWIAKGVVAAYLGISAVLVVASLIAWGNASDQAGGKGVGEWWALAFGVGATAAGLGILQLLGSAKGYGVLRPLIGTDRRFSTSLTQLGLWTLLVVTMFAFLLGRVVFANMDFKTVIPGARWDEYLLLLGGPFAAAVLAKGIVTYKVQEGTLQKSESATATPSQVVTADDGSADLVDAQYLLFNVVAISYVIVRLSATSALPQIPSPLLALTGATAATFVANKAAARNRPSITSLSPATAKPGDMITVLGTNFDPADQSDHDRRITISLSGFTERIYTNDSSDTKARFTVPGSATAGHQTVRIVSTAGVETEPASIEIRANTTVITGLAGPSTIRPNAEATIRGLNFGQPDERIGVRLGTMSTEGIVRDNGNEVAFKVPSTLPAGSERTIEITVTPQGKEAVTSTFAVDQPTLRSAWRARKDTAIVIRFNATGLSSTEGYVPRTVINGRGAPTAAHVQSDEYEVAVPDGVSQTGELQLVVVDDLGRASDAFRIAPGLG